MLTWRNFYQILGIDILKDQPCIKDVIVVYEVNIGEVKTFLISRGFRINSTLPWSDIKHTPSFLLTLTCPHSPYSLCKISFGTNDSCCFCNKPLNIYDLLIYLASQIYFFNTTASFFSEFRVFTSDGYDVSIVKNGVDDPMLCIGNKNQFVNECFYSGFRFALNSGTTPR